MFDWKNHEKIYWNVATDDSSCRVVSVCKRRIGLTGTALQNKYEAGRLQIPAQYLYFLELE